MYVELLYTGCLAEAAYYIESNGEAAIVDPLRETEPYIKLAEERGAKIKYVLETHFHADFVSGHLDLAKKTGAKIVYGPNASANFDIHVATDGEMLPLGNVNIKVLHTPGHTMESSCFLLMNEEGKEHGVFTGDTLFIGDVGRPDLAVKTDLSREDLAGHLFDSITQKLLTLADETIVYPGHGEGSQCGKRLSAEKQSTIGIQKKVNYALQPMSKEDFVKVVTDGLTNPPQYFPKNAVINKTGYESIDTVMERNMTPITVAELEQWRNEGVLLLDTRKSEAFQTGYIKGAMNVSLDGDFAVWVGTLVIELDTPIILITEHGREEESVLRLARVGYENVKGYLEDGIHAWQKAGKELEVMKEISANSFGSEFLSNDWTVLDVRRTAEYMSGHLADAINIPLAELPARMGELDKETAYAVHCESGYRSMIACSLLEKAGFTVANAEGGAAAMREAGVEFISELVTA